MDALTIPHRAVVQQRRGPRAGCGHCGDLLELVQPDPARPDRRVGYCSECDTFCLLVPGFAIELDLDALVAEARGRFAALRRSQAGALIPPAELPLGASAS